MCINKSDSEGEDVQLQLASLELGKSKKTKKRGRSPTEAHNTQLNGSRKRFKLDSAASTLANDAQAPPAQLISPRHSSKPISSATKLACDNDMAIEELPSSKKIPTRQSKSPARTLVSPPDLGADPSPQQRTTFLEAYHAVSPEAQYSGTFSDFLRLPISPALRFQLVRSSRMSNDDLATCFNLISTTSQADYAASADGWNPNQKVEEMRDREMMYLLVRQAPGYIGADEVEGDTKAYENAILGFLSFKFDVDDPPWHDQHVIYIYEIHLDDRLRGQGLGGWMLQWAEAQARLGGVEKMMLTVFVRNQGAMRLYKREGFHRDASSPENRELRGRFINVDYMIMSKKVKQL